MCSLFHEIVVAIFYESFCLQLLLKHEFSLMIFHRYVKIISVFPAHTTHTRLSAFEIIGKVIGKMWWMSFREILNSEKEQKE